jgi:hypothetical protein
VRSITSLRVAVDSRLISEAFNQAMREVLVYALPEGPPDKVTVARTPSPRMLMVGPLGAGRIAVVGVAGITGIAARWDAASMASNALASKSLNAAPYSSSDIGILVSQLETCRV